MKQKSHIPLKNIISIFLILILTVACRRNQARQPATQNSPASAPAQTGTLLFRDDFQDGEAQEWGVNSAWYVQQYGDVYLFEAFGLGGAWVTKGGGWTNYTFQAACRVDTGALILSIDLSQSGRYGLRLGSDGVYLLKEQPAGTYNVLAEAGPITSDTWHRVLFSSQNGHIQVSIDDLVWFDMTDSAPLPQGTIAVSALDGSHVGIDNVLVTKIQGTLQASQGQAPQPVSSVPVQVEDVQEEAVALPPMAEIEVETTDETDTTTIETGGMPDLVISEISFTPDPIIQGQNFNANYMILNQGNGASGAFTFRLHYHASAGIADCNMDVDSLAPGAVAWGSCTRLINGNPGGYPIEVTTDVEGEIAESDETNNLINSTITVAAASNNGPAGLPDLVVNEFNFAPNPVIQGQPFNVSYSILNQGDGASGAFTFRLHYHASAGIADCNMDVAGLAPGATVLSDCTRTINGNPGNYPIEVTADVEGEITESDETNNVINSTITVAAASNNGPAGLPDLVVNEFNFAPNPVIQGQPFNVSYSILNQGDGASGAFTFRLHYHASAGIADCNMDVAGLAPGATVLSDCTRTINGNPGNYPIEATVDVEGEIAESDEGNNTVSSTITVQAASLPANQADLIISQVDETEDGFIHCGIENTGSADAPGNVVLALLINEEFYSQQQIGPALLAGTGYGALVFIDPTNPPNRPFDATCVIDYSDMVPESNEGNNEMTVTIP